MNEATKQELRTRIAELEGQVSLLRQLNSELNASLTKRDDRDYPPLVFGGELKSTCSEGLPWIQVPEILRRRSDQ